MPQEKPSSRKKLRSVRTAWTDACLGKIEKVSLMPACASR